MQPRIGHGKPPLRVHPVAPGIDATNLDGVPRVHHTHIGQKDLQGSKPDIHVVLHHLHLVGQRSRLEVYPCLANDKGSVVGEGFKIEIGFQVGGSALFLRFEPPCITYRIFDTVRALACVDLPTVGVVGRAGDPGFVISQRPEYKLSVPDTQIVAAVVDYIPDALSSTTSSSVLRLFMMPNDFRASSKEG